MKSPVLARSIPCLLVAACTAASQAAVLNVLPGVNNVPITKVTYTVGGNDVNQLASAVGVTNVGDTPVVVKSVVINDNGNTKNLNYVNNAGATIVNVNPQLGTIAGIGVFDHGTHIASKNNLAAFTSALAVTTSNFDLRNFTYYDYLNPSPPTAGVPDYDILYTKAMNFDDYILVSERNGNTFFRVTPLQADGTPYAGANSLLFGGSGGNPYTVYNWNSGYAAASNNPDQAQAFSVASVGKFFEGTGVTPGPVYGFRIDNDGEADVKIVLISDNPFDDNPLRPVPEPSSAMAFAAGALALLARRRRA
ncbi:MAG: PEP-CTERM sorting domain-containing protein [Verrucomicrobiaceae bacterium]|nr:MAG: PEP-CTERM sorting domain-containing protein [Verrucomicrobiaceae bacterium]